MKILTLVILLTSNSIIGQVDSPEKSSSISKEEAINIAKCKTGYSLSHAKLDSNEWIIIYSKYVGQTKDCITLGSGVCGVQKNVSTRIDASTGKIIKRSKYNFVTGGGGPGPSQVHFLLGKRRKKMKVGNRKITVYY